MKKTVLGEITLEKKEKLIYEIAHNNIESVKEAIREGDDINYRDINNRTYLHVAVINYDIEITKLLVEAGAEIDCIDNNMNTPLIYAISENDQKLFEIAKYLIKKGADLDLKAGEYSARELIQMFEDDKLIEFVKDV